MRRFLPPRAVVRDARLSVGFTIATGAVAALAQRGPWYSWIGVALTGYAAFYYTTSLRWSLRAWRMGIPEPVPTEEITDINVMPWFEAHHLWLSRQVTSVHILWPVVRQALETGTSVTYAIHKDGKIEVLVST
jgi:hypothetical protein